MRFEPPSPEPTQHRRAARAERFLHLLDRIIDVGADIVDELRPDPPAEDAVPEPTPLARAQAYDTATRAIRRCMLVADRLEEIIADPDKQRAETHARQAAARARIIRDVEDAIARSGYEASDRESLAGELYERLEHPDSIADLEGRPVHEVVRDFCRDLGLTYQGTAFAWPRRTPDDIRDLIARATKLPFHPHDGDNDDSDAGSDDDDAWVVSSSPRARPRSRDG